MCAVCSCKILSSGFSFLCDYISQLVVLKSNTLHVRVMCVSFESLSLVSPHPVSPQNTADDGSIYCCPVASQCLQKCEPNKQKMYNINIYLKKKHTYNWNDARVLCGFQWVFFVCFHPGGFFCFSLSQWEGYGISGCFGFCCGVYLLYV